MKKFIATASAIIAATFFAPAAHAEGSFSEDQIKDINGIIAEYIKENPDAIITALENFRVQELARVEEESQEKAKNLSKSLKESDAYPYTGNKDGDIIVAEFFDYNCGYCKRALEGVQKLIKADDNIKVVFIELPILGEASGVAAKWSLAAEEQDKYFEYHQAIMNHRGQKTEEELLKLAELVGLDIEKLKKDVKDSSIQKQLDENRELAQSLGVSGTPGFIIEDQVVRGYVPYETLAKMIKDIRANKEN